MFLTGSAQSARCWHDARATMTTRGLMPCRLAASRRPGTQRSTRCMANTAARTSPGSRSSSSAIVAEETYVQRANNYIPRGNSFNGPSRRAFEQRTLKSDLLLVRPDDSDRLGSVPRRLRGRRKPVRDRSERLTRLFLDPSETAGNQISRIIQESARYNIGEIQRTINVPVLPLDDARAGRTRSRYRFKRLARPDRTGRARAHHRPSRVGRTSRVHRGLGGLRTRRPARPTLIRSPRGGDIPSRGRLWVEPRRARC